MIIVADSRSATVSRQKTLWNSVCFPLLMMY